MAFYYAILATFWQFFIVILNIFSKPNIYIWNRHFMLSIMVFVPSPYIKVSVSYDRIIKYVTGFAKRCIVHTSNFSTLVSHKICYEC